MFIIRDSSELSRPDAAAKLIKARDFWAFKEAERALADAQEQKERILLSARDAYEAERQRGFADGNERARLQQSGRMMEIVNQTVGYFSRLEADMVELVLEAVRKVVSDFDDRQRLTTVVKNCLDLLRSQKQLSLNVHPSQLAFLRGQVDMLRELYPSLVHIDVHPDPRLAVDACLVESDIGVVEASLSGQVEILKETLNAAIAPPLPVDGQGAAAQAQGQPPDGGVEQDAEPKDEPGGEDEEGGEDDEDVEDGDGFEDDEGLDDDDDDEGLEGLDFDDVDDDDDDDDEFGPARADRHRPGRRAQ